MSSMIMQRVEDAEEGETEACCEGGEDSEEGEELGCCDATAAATRRV